MGAKINKNNKAQVTIFIIIGIVIVGAILVVFFLRGDISSEKPTAELGAQQFVRTCVKDIVQDAISDIFDGGGQISPEKSIPYQNDVYNYLCYQGDFYLGCYNLHPALEEEIEKEIKDETAQKVQECFSILTDDLEEKGFFVKEGLIDYSIDLLPGKVSVNLKKKLDISKGNSGETIENFNFNILSPLYELANIAREVVNDESQYCNFEYNGFMILYPKYDIRRNSYIDSRLYNIIDRKSGEDFRFAVRSCAFPPGI